MFSVLRSAAAAATAGATMLALGGALLPAHTTAVHQTRSMSAARVASRPRAATLTAASRPAAAAAPATAQQVITDAFAPQGQAAVSWALAVARCESSDNPNALGPGGSAGLFQFMPGTFAGTPQARAGGSVWDPTTNAQAAAWMYSQGRKAAWGICNRRAASAAPDPAPAAPAAAAAKPAPAAASAPAPAPAAAPAPAPAASTPTSVQQIIINAFSPQGQAAVSWGLAVAKCESSYNPKAYNPSGASGLFQFMPSTFAETPQGKAGESIWDPTASAQAAAWMYSQGRQREWQCNP